MLAEMAGAFAYVYCGVSALATFTLTTAAKEAGFGGLLNVAFGFAFGIAFALITCAATSGGHFNPAMTLVFATLQGFPWRKVPLYIISQITGAFLACLCVYAQWYQSIHDYEALLTSAGLPLVSATGPAGIFCAIPVEGQDLRWLFVTEFIADAFIGFIIWACIDANNPFVSPRTVPFQIGLAYFCMIIGFGANTLSTNLARDLGARMMSAAFYGSGVFTVQNGYAAISILVNIPATFVGVLFYQFVMGDATKMLKTGNALPAEVHRELQRERDANNGEPGEYETYLRKHPTVRDTHATHEKESSMYVE